MNQAAEPAAVGAAAGARPRPASLLSRAGMGALFALTGLAFLTRAPLAGLTWGESDGARFLIGITQWLHHGAAAPHIYDKILAPGYYAAAVWLIARTGIDPAVLLNQISCWAAVASAPLLYAIGRRLTSPPLAAAGAALFLLSPGFWWLGIEPHPQGLAFFWLLLAIACLLQAEAAPRPAAAAMAPTVWYAAATLSLSLALLVKSDIILLAGIFPALQLRQDGAFSAHGGSLEMPRAERPSPAGHRSPATERSAGATPTKTGRATRWRRAGLSCAIPIAAFLLFNLARPALLEMTWSQAQRQTHAALREFLQLPHGVAIFKQLLPMITAPGLATLALAAAGLLLGFQTGIEARRWRRRWLWPLAAWVLPSVVFWGLMRGNNARHMAFYILLPLWAALERLAAGPLRRRQFRLGFAIAGLGVMILLLNSILVPPSSNTTLYPSGNVPASARDLAHRSRDLRSWLAASLAPAPHPAICYLGNYTLPYLQWTLLETGRSRRLDSLAGFGSGPADRLPLTSGGAADFIEVNTPAGFLRAAARCRAADAQVWSLEYTPAGLHEQFLGREWRQLPFARRWYPAAANPAAARRPLP